LLPEQRIWSHESIYINPIRSKVGTLESGYIGLLQLVLRGVTTHLIEEGGGVGGGEGRGGGGGGGGGEERWLDTP
jgi:hypothetical protein